MTVDTGTKTSNAGALVMFGATGDLAKLETFPALVGLVDRGVLDVLLVCQHFPKRPDCTHIICREVSHPAHVAGALCLGSGDRL